MSRNLLRLKKEGGVSLETPQRKRASSYIEGRISWFFCSCGKKLGVPLELQWVPQGPTRVASGKSSLHASCKGSLRIPLQSVPDPRSSSGAEEQPQGSSPVLTWILEFLWSFNRGVKPRLVCCHASPLCSRAVTVMSVFLSSLYRDLMLSVEVPPGCHTCHHVLSQYS